jgi:signal transduction histidine kinase
MIHLTQRVDAGASDFLQVPGELARLIREFDWSSTDLGPLETWPQSLKSVVSTLLLSPVPIVTLWSEPGYMIYNDAYSRFAGARHPGLLGSKVREGWSEVADFNDNIMKVVHGGGGTLVYKDRELVLDRTGRPEHLWTDLFYSPVLGENGKPAGVWAVVVETTDRVLAERRAAQERERQNQLMQQMPGFAAVLQGPEHRYEYVNQSYVQLAGPRDYLGHSVRTVFPELTGQGFYELLDQVYRTGRRYTAQSMPVKLQSHPERRFVDLLYEPIRNERGEINGIFVGGYDVTDMHTAHTALQESEARLREANERLEQRVEARTRELADSMEFTRLALGAVGGVGVWTYDILADKYFCDAAISKLYDIDPVEGAQGIPREDFLKNVHPADMSMLNALMTHGLNRSGDVEIEYRLRHRDGSIHWVLSRGHTYFNSAGQAVRRTGVGVDMTKQRLMEEQFRQAQKMEAVGQLTGGLAHDFNNLLAGISGSVEVIRALVAQGRTDSLDRYIMAALGASKRAAALTHRLLAFSRRQTLDPKPTDVNRLVQEMEELIRRTVGPQISLEVVGAGGLWPTLVDSNQLENALLNLCINARDAMPDGGRITIETANRWLDERMAAERDLPPGQYISLCVTDTGTGMTPEVAARAFDPFFTTKPIGEGTGLGLSMIYGFARQSGGQVRIYSELGVGTTMCVYLPRHSEAPEVDTTSRATPLPERGSGQIVLVVDDEPTVRMLVADVLEAAGYVGIEATDGSSALKILQTRSDISLLVTDVGLPGGLNGRQLADAARALHPTLKILFITGYAENAVVGGGRLEPGMELLTKPFAMDELSRRIRRLVDN